MWEAAAGGKELHFHLAGINNQNFLMRDEETGSFWQQVSGECVAGPMKGERLRRVPHDELGFALWRAEQPAGRVLRPDDTAPWRAFSEDWERKTAKMPVVTPKPAGDRIPDRELVVGIALAGASKAYPLDAILRQAPILDDVGGAPVVLVAGDDGRSIRAFRAERDGKPLDLYRKPGAPLRLVDPDGNEFDFTGAAVTGPAAGARLEKLAILEDYWFDWRSYNPGTRVYGAAGR